MSIIKTNEEPIFNITRASHIVLSSRDLDKTRYFYETGIGLEVTAHEKDYLSFRAMEETSHHSLVFIKADSDKKCSRVGYRMYSEEDLKKAKDFFNERGEVAKFVERPYQGLTLHVTDGVGVPLEFCAIMEEKPSLMQKFNKHKSGHPAYLDHYQIATHDVKSAYEWYSNLGFRLTEYTADDETNAMWGVWLKRKNNTQDIVYSNGAGPKLHHFAFAVPDVTNIIHAADVMSSLGLSNTLDRGPGRHGIANAFFVYFLDPDGHRIELFTSHYNFIDINKEPLRWGLKDTRRSQLWGMPATRKWFFECTEFENTPVKEPFLKAPPVTLETFLENMS